MQMLKCNIFAGLLTDPNTSGVVALEEGVGPELEKLDVCGFDPAPLFPLACHFTACHSRCVEVNLALSAVHINREDSCMTTDIQKDYDY